MKKTVKICIYNKSSSKNDVLLGNGDAILDNICIECKVHENINGDYDLDAEFIIDNEGLWQLLEEEAILKVRLDYGYEYFRIIKPRKTTNRIVVYARQVTIYETMHLWLTDVRPENQNGLGALNWILNGATGNKELEVSSDISATSTAYYMDMNMYEALHDCDQCFTNRWGGEIQRRGYTLRINQRIGTDRGVLIRSRKNLTGFEANTNIDNVVTRIKPKGFDGITIDGYVDSKNINKYPRIKTKEIKYESVKLKDEQNPDGGYDTLSEAQAELTRLANLEYSEKHIDVITAEYNISFVDLSKTEEYKNFVQAERVYLGDTVDVYEEKIDIHVAVRVIERKYDVLGERVEEIKLSNKDIGKIQSLNDILTDILKGVQENDNSLQLYIQNVINSGIQDSYVFYNKAELVICDTPKIEDAVNVWRFNRGGLAHSSNGYNGPYNVAITYDGKINADMILAGLVKGNYIDAKNLVVTDENDNVTFRVNSTGEVTIQEGIVKLDKYGLTIKHNDGSSTNLNSSSLNFYDSSNLLYAQVNGGLYKFWNGSNYIGYLGHAKWVGSDNRAVGMNSEYGQMSTLGSKKNSDDSSYQVYVIANGCDQTINDVRYRQGLTLITPHCGTRFYLYRDGYYTDSVPSFIVNNNEGHIIVAGDNGVNLGAQVGSDYYDAIRVTEISSSPYVQVEMWGNLDMHNWSIVNANISNSVSATSAASYSLRSLSEEESYSDPTSSTITDIYGVQSLTNGEVRWSDKVTYFTSEWEEGVYEAYIELPWWLAQNIEIDYHVNITPVNGFYQYYVSERDPYYFIVKSDKDSMGFTFELVATLLEQNTLNNNVSIAGSQYLSTEINDGEQPDISVPEIGKNIS